MLTLTKPNLTLRINYEKCTVALRNQRLVELADVRIGETTSQVYAELLRLLEDRIPRCRLDPKIDDVSDLGDGPAVTTMEVAACLNKSIDVGNGIGKVSGDSVDTRALERSGKSKKRKADETEVEGEASEDEDESGDDADANGNGNVPEVDQEESDGDDPFEDDAVMKPPKRPKVTFQEKLPKPEQFGDRQNRTAQVKNHLQLLANDTCGFLKKGGSRGQGEWTVNYERIIEYLREAELDQMLLENFGRGGHRLARMMRKLGKLEEKQLPGLAFMKQKDIRTKLAEMQMAGMVDIQEVPRDAGRTTSRTMFLWYFDTERVSAILLDSLYKCMSRSFQRLDIERRRIHEILIAMQRQDTKGKAPEEYLELEPLNRLRAFQDKEELLLTQIGRLDELIGIFRDY
jgi:DNA-directed RNA polymerase III subunit RPC3